MHNMPSVADTTQFYQGLLGRREKAKACGRDTALCSIAPPCSSLKLVRRLPSLLGKTTNAVREYVRLRIAEMYTMGSMEEVPYRIAQHVSLSHATACAIALSWQTAAAQEPHRSSDPCAYCQHPWLTKRYPTL